MHFRALVAHFSDMYQSGYLTIKGYSELTRAYTLGIPNAEDAVAQVGRKGYLVPFEAGAKPVVEVGVAYSEEARTIDEDWVIREA